MVEEVSGQGFAEYVEQHVFAPLGMDSSSFALEAPGLEPVAEGHVNGEVQPRIFINPLPAGSLRTSVPGPRALREGDARRRRGPCSPTPRSPRCGRVRTATSPSTSTSASASPGSRARCGPGRRPRPRWRDPVLPQLAGAAAGARSRGGCHDQLAPRQPQRHRQRGAADRRGHQARRALRARAPKRRARPGEPGGGRLGGGPLPDPTRSPELRGPTETGSSAAPWRRRSSCDRTTPAATRCTPSCWASSRCRSPSWPRRSCASSRWTART